MISCNPPLPQSFKIDTILMHTHHMKFALSYTHTPHIYMYTQCQIVTIVKIIITSLKDQFCHCKQLNHFRTRKIDKVDFLHFNCSIYLCICQKGAKIVHTKYTCKTSLHGKVPNPSSGGLSKCMYTCTTAKMFDDNIMHVLYYAHMEVHIIYIVC